MRKVVYAVLTAVMVVTAACPHAVYADYTSKEQYLSAQDELGTILYNIDMIEMERQRSEREIMRIDKQIRETSEGVETIRQEVYEIIRRMYEKGDKSGQRYLASLMGDGNYGEVLNQATYLKAFQEYEAARIEEYAKKQMVLEILKGKMEDKKADLDAMQDELKDQKDRQEELVAQLKRDYEDYEAYIERARQEAAARASQASLQQAAVTFKPTIDPNGLGASIVNYAFQFKGNPYVWGGTSLTNGTDCSGFIQSLFREFGISVSRTTYSQEYDGIAIPLSKAQPGDIILYPGHVGLYIGNGQIIHASNAREGIKVSDVFYRSGAHARRLIP